MLYHIYSSSSLLRIAYEEDGEVRERNFHMVIGGVALPNIKSEKLHEKLGFKKVAHFSEVGFEFNKWIDVGYWEFKL